MPLTVRRRLRPDYATPLRVVDPIRQTDYPEGVFILSDADLKNIHVRALLPAGVKGFGGGKFGDLEVVADAKDAPAYPARAPAAEPEKPKRAKAEEVAP